MWEIQFVISRDVYVRQVLYRRLRVWWKPWTWWRRWKVVGKENPFGCGPMSTFPVNSADFLRETRQGQEEKGQA